MHGSYPAPCGQFFNSALFISGCGLELLFPKQKVHSTNKCKYCTICLSNYRSTSEEKHNTLFSSLVALNLSNSRWITVKLFNKATKTPECSYVCRLVVRHSARLCHAVASASCVNPEFVMGYFRARVAKSA